MNHNVTAILKDQLESNTCLVCSAYAVAPFYLCSHDQINQCSQLQFNLHLRMNMY